MMLDMDAIRDYLVEGNNAESCAIILEATRHMKENPEQACAVLSGLTARKCKELGIRYYLGSLEGILLGLALANAWEKSEDFRKVLTKQKCKVIDFVERKNKCRPNPIPPLPPTPRPA